MLREFNAILRKTALGVLIATLLVGVMPVELLGSGINAVKAASYSSITLDVPYFPQKISQDCGISSASMIEAYALGYGGEYYDAVYEAVFQASGFTKIPAYTRYIDIHSSDESTRLRNIYNQLVQDKPVLIYRTGGAGDHWSVITGYNGSATTLEKSGFIVWNTGHNLSLTNGGKTNLATWLNGSNWEHTRVRGSEGLVASVTQNVEKLILENVFYRNNKKQGESMAATGLLISPTKITSVEFGVKDAGGTKKFSASASPNRKYFGLMNFDDKASFRGLESGNYTYYVYAKDSTGAVLDFQQGFKVSSSESSALIKQTYVAEGSGSSSGGPSTVTSAYPLVDGGEYIIRSALSDKAIEIGSGNSSNGVQAQVWSYDTSGASKWQRWKAVKQSNGYSFVNVGTGKAMDIDNASTSSGAKLQQYTANNSSAQTFQLVEHNGKYAMIADCSGMAIDLCGSDTSNGAKLDQHPYHGGDNQLWTFESTSLSITDNGVSGITATTARLNGALPNAYGSTGIEVTDIGFYYGTSSSNLQKVSEKETQRVKIYWYDLGDSKWTDVLKPNTTYYYKLYAVIAGHTYESPLKSFKTEKVVSASSYPAVYPLEDGGTYAIRSVLSDRIIEVSNGKLEDRTVSMYSFAKQHAYMQWKAVRQSDGYTFINMGTEKALELHSGSSREGDLLWQSTANGSAKQTFKIIEYDGNYALIPNCSGLAVAIQGADTDNSALLEQQKFTGDTSQIWFFERIGVDQPDVITPSISEAYISDITGDGYKVTCTVYDNVGITKLKFPTWTIAGNQDDLKWHTLSISNPQGGTQTYTYQIKVSDHNNEHGTYATHVYAYDDAGNNTTYAIPTVVVGIYKVNYNANGGNDAPSAQSKEHGVKLTLSSSEPTRSGYTFKNWNTKSDGSGTSYGAGATYTANEGTTLYAQWTANTYTIKYDANGGSGAPSSQIKTQDTELTLSSTKPTREGYAFLGWNTHSDGAGTNYNAGSLFSEDANITLYAQWEIKKLGDMDGDGRISSRDNLLIYNHIAKKKTLSDEDRQIADVDGDGRITARDNLLIYNHITGKASLWK